MAGGGTLVAQERSRCRRRGRVTCRHQPLKPGGSPRSSPGKRSSRTGETSSGGAGPRAPSRSVPLDKNHRHTGARKGA